MKNGHCTKHYSKVFQQYTTTTKDGYPFYAHLNDGRSFFVFISRIRNVDLDNHWIVLYNSYILAKFHCHTNIESVATFYTIKYCFKYIHKYQQNVKCLE